jgi:hypothetical protein
MILVGLPEVPFSKFVFRCLLFAGIAGQVVLSIFFDIFKKTRPIIARVISVFSTFRNYFLRNQAIEQVRWQRPIVT